MKIKSILKEASFSRILTHVSDGSSFAVISAFRERNTNEQHLKFHKSLKQDIKSLGLGFIEQNSGYTYSDPDSGEEGSVEEMSVFVPKMDFKQVIKLGNKYGQESVLFKDNTRFIEYNLESNLVVWTFAETANEPPLTFKPEVLKYAYSQFIKRNKNVKESHAFSVKELIIPSRTESMSSFGTGRLAEAKWKEI